MSDLIEALQIFLKYGNPKPPISCEDDLLMIREIDPQVVSDEDKQKLKILGFDVEFHYDFETPSWDFFNHINCNYPLEYRMTWDT